MTCNNESARGTSLANAMSSNALGQFATFDDLIEYSTNPTSRFNSDDLAQIFTNANTLLFRHDLSPYSTLESRFSQGKLTQIELSDFMVEWKYSSSELLNILTSEVGATRSNPETGEDITGTNITRISPEATTTNSEKVFKELDQFLVGNISASLSSNVCSIFTTAAAVFSSIDSARDINLDKLSDLSNPNRVFERLVNVIPTIVDDLAEKYTSQTENLVNNALNTISEFDANAERVFNVINKKAYDIEEFLSDTNLTNLKDKSESVITRLVAQFQEMDSDKIEFIMYRMCQYTQIMDAFMGHPVDNMQTFTNTAVGNFETVAVAQSFDTVVAVSNGSWRIPVDERTRRRRAARASINNNPAFEVPYIPAQMSIEEMQMVRNLTSSGNQYFDFSDSVKNMGSIATTQYNKTGIESNWNPTENKSDSGWKYVAIHHPELYVKLSRISTAMGIKFRIISAYRSPWYNRVYQRRILGNTGAAVNSLHMSGMALDVAMRFNGVDYNADHAEFTRYASREGIMGIALYPNFVHIDVGRRRTWNTSKTLTVEERNVLQEHLKDQFRA